MAASFQMVKQDGAVFVTNSEQSTPFIEIDGLESELDKSGCGLLLITGVAFKEQDIVTQIVAAEDERFLYIFGKNFGPVTISGLLYLGKNGGTMGAPLHTVDQFFQENRVSNSKEVIKVSMAGKANKKLQVAIQAMQVEPADANFNLYKFSISGIMVPTPVGSK